MIPVESVTVHAFEFPTDGPDGKEQDGTLTWSSTVIILVEARAGGQTGIGYTYGDVSAAMLAETKLAGVVTGADALSPPMAWREMSVQLRNAGQPGVGAMATSAVSSARLPIDTVNRPRGLHTSVAATYCHSARRIKTWQYQKPQIVCTH